MFQLFCMPSLNYIGEGAIEGIKDNIRERGLKKSLIVTDNYIFTSDIFKWVINTLYEAESDWIVYSDTKPNPTDKNVHSAWALLKKNRCDYIISIGGGSSHDCAKGAAILATNGGEIRDYEGVNRLHRPILPLITINTTAGTASEMTYFCIITDGERHVKMAILDPKITPWISVNDPLTMKTMPPGLTAATGMDALTHAIEAFVSINANPITDSSALRAISLIVKYLPRAVADGLNLEAREKMTYAEFLAGMAFNNASLGYVHAIAHQLGGIYNLPHGICNAVLLPYVEEFNSKAVPDKFIDIADAMGIDTKDKTPQQCSELVIRELKALNKKLGIPSAIGDLGVKREDFRQIALNALSDACAKTNPVQTDEIGIIKILEDAY